MENWISDTKRRNRNWKGKAVWEGDFGEGIDQRAFGIQMYSKDTWLRKDISSRDFRYVESAWKWLWEQGVATAYVFWRSVSQYNEYVAQRWAYSSRTREGKLSYSPMKWSWLRIGTTKSKAVIVILGLCYPKKLKEPERSRYSCEWHKAKT